MIICVGQHPNDQAAEQAARDAGFGTEGLGGSKGLPEPGVYYYPLLDGKPTGWVRVWSREEKTNSYRWMSLDPGALADASTLGGLSLNEILNKANKQAKKILSDYELSETQLGSALKFLEDKFQELAEALRPVDITYNPNKGAPTGKNAGQLLHAEYHGQEVRQWIKLPNHIFVWRWIAYGFGDKTTWIPLRTQT